MSAEVKSLHALARREVVIGRNAKIWRAMGSRPAMTERFKICLSHAEIDEFSFSPNDRVWIFAYSRHPAENSKILHLLRDAGVQDVIYVSSASTIVNRQTECYQYPRVKQQAEEDARRLLDAQILTLGLVYENMYELPAGLNIATSHSQLAEFMLAPYWPHGEGNRMHLFSMVERPFDGHTEQILQRLYGVLLTCVSRWPCILRPIDAVLRTFGIRWYGYVYLSNRLWITTTS